MVNVNVYVVVLCESMNFPLSVSPSKEMGDSTRKEKEIFSLPRVVSHFLTRANSQWEIHGLT